MTRLPLILWSVLLSGCWAPSDRLDFPSRPLRVDERGRHYDLDGDGRVEFSLVRDAQGRMDLLEYDDDQDGHADRLHRLSDHSPDSVPHIVLALDSIPYRTVAERHQRGDWPWFGPPAKVIPPYPTMSGVIFTDIFHAPPLDGVINRHFNRATGRTDNQIVSRVFGQLNPWHQRMHYIAEYWENGLSFLQPRPWFAAEMARAMRAADQSPERVTLLYIASSSGLVSRYGEQGVNEALDAIEPFCVRLIHDRRGAVKITVLADHGHNYRPGRRVDIEAMVRECGYRPAEALREERDVVTDVDGLVNYAGLHTRRPAELAQKLALRPQTQLVSYQQGDRVMALSERGAAAIERRDGRLRYLPLSADVLGYGPVVERLRLAGRTDELGFVADADWLEATADHEFPDAPPRLWRAHHDLVRHPPDIMIALRDDHCIGLESFEWFIDMASTHGGLDQINSATFVLDMTGRLRSPLRSRDILPTILPGFVPGVIRR
jgi:hypothetical protein